MPFEDGYLAIPLVASTLLKMYMLLSKAQCDIRIPLENQKTVGYIPVPSCLRTRKQIIAPIYHRIVDESAQLGPAKRNRLT